MEKKKSIYKVSFYMVLFGIIIKILGFVKQSVVAYYYGATGETDIYFVANGFINSVSSITISAVSVAFISVYTKVKVCKEQKESSKLVSGMMELMGIVALLLMLMLYVGMPFLTNVLAPSYNEAQKAQLSLYLVILSGLFLVNGCEMVLAGVLKCNEKYYILNLKSLLYTGAVILACVFFSSKYSVNALIGAEYIAWILNVFVLFLVARRFFEFRFVIPFFNPDIKSVLVMIPPVIIGNSIIELGYIVDRSVASSLSEGVVSALYYGQVVDQLITTVLIASICSVLIARFANLVAEGKREEFEQLLNNNIGIMVLILSPISVVMFSEAKEIAEVIYFRGSFQYETMCLVALAMQGYALRYPFMAIRDLLIQAQYACRDTKSPMINGACAVAVNIVISIIGSKYFGILAIALGTSISAIMAMLLNMRSIKRCIPGYDFGVLYKTLIQNIPAVFVSAICVWFMKKILNIDVTFVEIIIMTLVVFVPYCLVMLLQKNKEMIMVKDFLVKRVFRDK